MNDPTNFNPSGETREIKFPNDDLGFITHMYSKALERAIDAITHGRQELGLALIREVQKACTMTARIYHNGSAFADRISPPFTIVPLDDEKMPTQLFPIDPQQPGGKP